MFYVSVVPDDAARFFQSTRNPANHVMVDSEYFMYWINKKNDLRTFWNCSLKAKGCPSKAVTIGSRLVRMTITIVQTATKSFANKLQLKFQIHYSSCLIADNLEEAIFMKSKYGNAVLTDKAGYMYRCNLKKESRIYWRCRNSEKFKCNARAVTDGFHVTSWTNGHTHHPPVANKDISNCSV